ncbi:MAG: anthranilate phosphoribosyltransferase [Anaerosomatales bacterium]|nr:anthranilate phosphoribosyltransferase [Anaerosomatales bacterium]
MILVIDNYDSFTYNLVQLVAALGADVRVERNDAVTAAQVVAMSPAGVIVSPGPGLPADAGASVEVVRAAAGAGIPVLGVCLGHQAIAEAFGGRVVRAPRPVHGKTADVFHSGEGLLAGMPNPFTATRYHSLVVDLPSLPLELEVTARTEDGLVMAMRHRSLPVYGVQFHPESVLTPEGVTVLENFLALAGELSDAEGAAPADPIPDAAARAAVSTLPAAIDRAVAGHDLTEDEAHAVMGLIMDGEATSAQIASLVTAIRMKGETADEIVGFARAMRERATPVRPTVGGYIDTCGTGGDGLATFNVSTAAAFVVAGAGVPVAKHGNRAVSSRAGSADVLEALGVRIDLTPQEMARCVDEAGLGFLFAQALHASMRHAGGPRREIAIRTVFNILGPLTNPAGASRQVLGVYDPALVPVMAEVASRLGAEKVLVVHGHPGMDEVSASGPTEVAEATADGVRLYAVTPEAVGIARGSLADLLGGTAEENAAVMRAVLGGEHAGARDVVLMNAAAALVAAGAADDFAAGVVLARASIDTGAALGRLEALVTVSNRLAAQRETGGEVSA